jgi:hypothetical protein
MPSTSAKQAKFMRAVSHNPKFAKKAGVPQSVGKEYEMVDKKKGKFGSGGPTNVEPKGFKPAVRIDLDKAKRDTTQRDADKRRYDTQKKAMEKKYPFIKYGEPGKAEGGKVMKKATKAGRALVKKSADTMGRAMKMKKGGSCYAAGGLVGGHKSADGIAKRGKTKGMKC